MQRRIAIVICCVDCGITGKEIFNFFLAAVSRRPIQRHPAAIVSDFGTQNDKGPKACLKPAV
jgi:hypothetical protein